MYTFMSSLRMKDARASGCSCPENLLRFAFFAVTNPPTTKHLPPTTMAMTVGAAKATVAAIEAAIVTPRYEKIVAAQSF